MRKEASDSTVGDSTPAPAEQKVHTKGRWLTPEFFFYYVIIFVGYFFVIRLLLERSEAYNNIKGERYGIVDGWIPGRKEDLSDMQWSVWRSFFPLITLGIGAFVALSQFLRRSITAHGRVIFYTITGTLFILFLHGTAAFFLFAVALANYALAKGLGKSSLLPAATWIFNVTMLVSSYMYQGYRFENLLGPTIGTVLDQHRGLLSWETYFKVSFLRFVSFNMDHYWMIKNRPVVSLKGRAAYFIAQEQHLLKTQYDLKHFVAYIFYPPLYIAGPIVSFNAFIHQIYTPQTTYTFSQLVKSSLHILGVLVGFEVVLHFIYFHAFNEHDLWKQFSPPEVAVTGYFVLNFMYVKFLIIWRIFRLGSQFDGIDTPENMNRCVNNNYTFTGFWRSWHGSFNMWTLRYLYIPLGGKKTQKMTIWLVFLFIGLWHDLFWNWVAWALLNCMFFSAEIVVLTYFHKQQWLHAKWWYRHLCAAAGTTNVFLLMIANLAILHGFGDSYVFVHNAFLAEGGPTTFILAWCWLYTGVIVMGEIREREMRNANTKRF